jgi:HEAT repeat protein
MPKQSFDHECGETVVRSAAMLFVMLAFGCGGHSTDNWLRQLKDADVVKRREAIRELGARTKDANRVVPALTEALKDESGFVRRDAAVTLGKFGADARSGVPALVESLQDKEPSVRSAAAASLKKIDPEAVRAEIPSQ